MKKWLLFCLATTNVYAVTTIPVSSGGDLVDAINMINSGGSGGSYDVVFMKQIIQVTQGLPPLNISPTGAVLNNTVVFEPSIFVASTGILAGGNNLFFIVGGDVTFNTISLSNGTSRGGDGSDGGGGGLGAGGAIFVNQGASCTLNGCALPVPENLPGSANTALGGTAQPIFNGTGGGGGGMLGGAGAAYTVFDTTAGGGGGGGLTNMNPAIPGAGTFGAGGSGGGYSPGAGGAAGNSPVNGSPAAAGTVGGGGGGGGANNSMTPGLTGGNGGAGTDFGGGGGGGFGTPLSGPGANGSGGNGGMGGWGGGGGSCGFFDNNTTSSPPPFGPSATSVFGGGLGFSGELAMTPNLMSGTGGDGYGGAIFVRQGGTLIVKTTFPNGVGTLYGNRAIPGNNGDPRRTGLAAGNDLYVDTGVIASFQPDSHAGLYAFQLGSVAGPGGIILNPLNSTGLLIMLPTSNQYTGGTTIDDGILQITSGTSLPGPLGTGDLTFNGGTLQLLNFSSPNESFQASAIVIGANTVTFDSAGTTSNIATVIEGSGTVIFESSSSGGVLFPTGNNTTQTWQTQIQSGTLTINGQSLPTTPTPTMITFTGTSTLKLEDSLLTNPITINGGVTGIIDGNGNTALIHSNITGAGTLELTSDPNSIFTMLTLNGTNTYGSTSIVANGAAITVFIQNTASLPTGTNVSLSNVNTALPSTLNLGQLGPVTVSIGDLTGMQHTAISLGQATLSVTTSTPDVFAGVISSSSGGLIVKGTSKLTLTNSNTYSGGTSLQGGTLAITMGNSAGLTSGTISFDNDSTFQLAGNISSLAYPINVAGGVTGNIDADGFTSSIDAGITLNSSTLNLMNSSSTASSLTLNGVISGPGSLTVNGPGTFIITANNGPAPDANGYTGPTTVSNSATLALSGDNGSIASSQSLTVNAGAFFDISNVTNFLGLAEVFDLSGAGTVTMGSNSLVVNSVTGSTFSGTMTGNDSLFKVGSGTLVLTGHADYLGGTIIAGGVLALENAFSFADPATIMALSSSGATLDISMIAASVRIGDLSGVSGTIINLGTKTLFAGGPDNTTYAGTITGAGNFTKTGSGRLNLTAPNTIGSTTVQAGLLSVNGQLTSPVTVENGGTLGGSATIVGLVTVESGGIISPGNSIGMQTYMGDLIEGGIYAVEVNNTPDSTFLTVTGTADLTGGFVGLTVDPGVYQPGQRYEILTAGSGLLGTQFAGVIAYPGFAGSLEYIGSDVFLLLSQQFIPPVCNTGNSTLVSYINEILVQDATFTYVYVFGNLVFESCSNITNALNLVSGSTNTATSFAATINAIEFNKLISAHMFKTRFNTMSAGMGAVPLAGQPASISDLTAAANSGLSPSQKVQMAKEEGFTNTVWATGFGNWLHEDATSRIHSFNLRTGGFFVGYDAYAVEHGFFGAGAGLSKSSVRFHDGTKGHVDSVGTAVYGTWTRWGYFVQLSALGSYNRLSDHRHIYFTGFDEYAVSSHNDWQFAPQVGFGYDADFSWGCVEPYVLFDFIWNWEHSYTETQAAPINLHVHGRSSSMMRSEVGITFYQDWKWDEGVMIEINETLAYVNRLPMKKGNNTASFFPLPGGFNVVPFNRTENLFAPGLEIYLKGKHDIYTVFTYEGEFGPKSIENEARVTLGKYF